MPDEDQKKHDFCDYPGVENEKAIIRKVAGEQGVKTAEAACVAIEEGRLGYAVLMAAKLDFHDFPVHQFSAGDSPKPADTPSQKSSDRKPTSPPLK